MSMMRWDPWRDLQSLQSEMGRMFERAFGPTKAGRAAGWTPAIDMVDKDGAIVVSAELPGVKPEDIDISIVDKSLRITGERKTKEEVKEKNYYRMEQQYGSFERVIPLPSEVKPEGIKATYKDGVLEITLPKAQPEKAQETKVKVEE